MNYELIKKTVDRILENKYVWEFDGNSAIKCNDKTIPLSTWLFNHKLEAMRKLAIKDKQLKKICSYKSTVIRNVSKDLFEALREELGTCEWMLDDKIKSLYGVYKENLTVSFVLKTEKDILCLINVACTLSDDTPNVVKYEIVGEEGVISDRAINEQIPVEAIYLFSNKERHPTTFTDIDFNMLGLTIPEVIVADSVAYTLTNAQIKEDMIKADARSRYLVDLAKKSLETETLILEEN